MYVFAILIDSIWGEQSFLNQKRAFDTKITSGEFKSPDISQKVIGYIKLLRGKV